MIEVKNDLLANKTGNVAIEIICVERSKSPVWIYKLCEEFWAINIKNLRDLKGKIVYGGDGNRSKLKLVPINIFKRYARQL